MRLQTIGRFHSWPSGHTHKYFDVLMFESEKFLENLSTAAKT